MQLPRRKAVSSIDESNAPAQSSSFPRKSGAWHGALAGLIPLILLIVMIVVVFILTAVARQLVAASGFFAQQQAALLVLITGLVLAVGVYIVAIVFTFRRVAAWKQGGAVVRVRAALWALGVTALLVVLPVLLAIVLPQQPAP
jgi:hypothetical protein